MRIRPSRIEDIDTIMQIYDYARSFMASHDNPNQWGPNNWPPKALIENDIASGKSYVCVDEADQILGTFFFDYGIGIEHTYNVIEDGEWIGSNEYGVVHRIASAGKAKGVGEYCLNWAYEQCGHIRIDTHSDNYVMQNLLTKLKFKKCGIIHIVQDPYPRIAFEK